MTRPTARSLATLLSLACAPIVGCSCTDTIATEADTGTNSTIDAGHADAPFLVDAAIDTNRSIDDAAAPDGSLVAFCAGEGPIVVIGEGDEDLCTGTLAESSFRLALCSCLDYVGSHPLTTDAFDSSMGPYTPETATSGASVGTNGNWNSTAASEIGGSLTVAGSASITVSSDLVVHGHLRAGGRIDHNGAALRVGHDAQIAGDIVGTTLEVDGTLTQPAGARIDSTSSTIGTQASGAVAITPPCNCASPFDVAALVARHEDVNDDGTIGLSPAVLQNYPDGMVLELPCGRYFFDGIYGTGALTIRLSGRTAIFVAGDASFQGDLRVELAEGAEVDLFVSGNVLAASAFVLGSATAPSRARLYVGGTGTLQLSGAAISAGNLYAPRAELVAAGGLELYGSAFVRRVSSTGPIVIHYDRSVSRAGEECPPPPGMCDACDACGARACVDGVCTDCRTAADCCPGNLCEEGRCVPELF